MNINKSILITGGNSRFCKYLKKQLSGKNVIYSTKKQLDILNYEKLIKVLKQKKIKTLIHVAALSRPMAIHDKKLDLSIDTNIIGTANVVKACNKLKIKLIYFSTNYVYPCKNGNYKETDPIFPINNYGWSKLGGECAVQMLKNFLILRLAMTDFPFSYKAAIKNAYSSFIYNKDFAEILPHILDEKGIINVGTKKRSIFNFAKQSKKNIKGIKINKNSNFPIDSSINISKFKKIIKKNVKKSYSF